ncbi:type II toxin-antitoxin system RelE/ParE family toxin [Crocinitomix algicola]|uniref:type II toxin-antitoxin system RelE/ParE family toxin n=1 Tax=Crocinitomix algicola TaxID=1740263 RepID=UPI000872A282|nr:type II toxin-antitoxin system RelE/ParE family toxin [Crocinitomix algicola]
MEVEFRSKELEDLYEGKKPKSKAFKSNKKLVKNYVKTVKKIQGAQDLNTLKQIRSLNLENLTNHPQGFSSVRIDDKYRLIIDLVKDDEDDVKLIGIEEISNHYS